MNANVSEWRQCDRRAAHGRCRSTLSEWSDRHFKWLLVAPAVLLILALSIYPLLFSIWVAFVNYDFQIPGHAFVGLKNFQQVVFDPVARWSLGVTVDAVRRQRRPSSSCSDLRLALAMVEDVPRPRPDHVAS